MWITVLISQLGASRRNRGDHESIKPASIASVSLPPSVPASFDPCCGSTPFDIPLACGSNRLIGFFCKAYCKELWEGGGGGSGEGGGGGGGEEGGGGGGGGGTAEIESAVRGSPEAGPETGPETGAGAGGGTGGSEFRSFELVKPLESREEKERKDIRSSRLYTFFRWKEKREHPSGHPRKDSELTRRVSCIKACCNLQRGATDYERFSFDARTSEG